MQYLDQIDISQLQTKIVPFQDLINDFKEHPVSTHVARGKRLGCSESNIRRMLKVLQELNDKFEEEQSKLIPVKEKPVYLPTQVFGYDASKMVYRLKLINEHPILRNYIDEDTKEFIVHVIKELKDHPDSALDDRMRRLCLVKIHTFTRYNLWRITFTLNWLYLRLKAYQK